MIDRTRKNGTQIRTPLTLARTIDRRRPQLLIVPLGKYSRKPAKISIADTYEILKIKNVC